MKYIFEKNFAIHIQILSSHLLFYDLTFMII